MGYFPTWLPMLLLSAAFIMIGVQHSGGYSEKEGNVLTIARFVMLLVCFLLMILTVFFNKEDGWASSALFIAAVISLGTAIGLQRLSARKKK